MKKPLLLLLIVFASPFAQAQIYTAQTVKNVFIEEYKAVPDSAIVYPIRGFFMVSSRMMYSIPLSALEYFVLDANGNLLYYNIYTLAGAQNIKDREYARYMNLQGMHQCKIKSKHS